jgi:hypothetical protein
LAFFPFLSRYPDQEDWKRPSCFHLAVY